MMTEKPKFRIAVMGHSFMSETPATPSQWAMERARTLASEVCIQPECDPKSCACVYHMARALDAAAAEEREAIAKMVDDLAAMIDRGEADDCAAAIRARGSAKDEDDGA